VDTPVDRMNHKEIERWYRLRNLKKASQFLVVFFVVLLVGAFVASRLVRERSDQLETGNVAGSGIRVEKFSYSSPGAQPWELEATEATVSESLDRVALSHPRVVFHGGNGGTIYLSSTSGTLDKKSSNVTFNGDVEIRLRDFTFRADDIAYSHEKHEVRTESPVSLEGPEVHVTGRGLKMFLETEEAVIENDVQARIDNVKWVDAGGRMPL
jgi:LPS export ABC transporter protein LptC